MVVQVKFSERDVNGCKRLALSDPKGNRKKGYSERYNCDKDSNLKLSTFVRIA